MERRAFGHMGGDLMRPYGGRQSRACGCGRGRAIIGRGRVGAGGAVLSSAKGVWVRAGPCYHRQRVCACGRGRAIIGRGRVGSTYPARVDSDAHLAGRLPY
eukprot:5893051-Prymnesium_polylepis.1